MRPLQGTDGSISVPSAAASPSPRKISIQGIFHSEASLGFLLPLVVHCSDSLTGIVSEVGALLGEEDALREATAAGLRVITWGDGK